MRFSTVNAARVSLQGLRLIGKGVHGLLILVGVMAVGGAIDVVPYVGSPQFDYYPMDFSKPFWPQILGQTVPFALTGAFVAVLCLAGLRGRFSEPAGLRKTVLLGIGWGLAALGSRLSQEAFWRWPLDLPEMTWIARYALINALTSSLLLVGVQAFVDRYVRWGGRPRTRWGALALWFAISSLAIVAFLSAMTIIGELSVSQLIADAWQMILILGGLLAVCAATAPKAPNDQGVVGPAGLEPATRPL